MTPVNDGTSRGTPRPRLWSRAGAVLATALVASWATQSCRFPDDTFECSADADCTSGDNGACEEHQCTFDADPGDCASGRRYGPYSRNKNACVSGDDGGPGGGSGGRGGSGGSSQTGGKSGGTGALPGTGGGSETDGGTGGDGPDTGVVPPDPDKRLTLYTGTIGGRGSMDATGTFSRFASPGCIAYDGDHFIYIGDGLNHTIRRYDTKTTETVTLAGRPLEAWYDNGIGGNAHFEEPECLTYDGPSKSVYIAEWRGNRIRRLNLVTNEVTLVAGAEDSSGARDEGVGKDARFKAPMGLARGAGNTLYVADSQNHAVRAIDLSTGTVTTVAGSPDGTPGTTDGAATTAATLATPFAILFDSSHNRLFIGGADSGAPALRVLDLATSYVSTVVPNLGAVGQFAYDASTDTLFAAAVNDGRVLQISVAQKNFKILSGPGDYGDTDGSPAQAGFKTPHGIVVVGDSLYVADYDGYTLRQLTKSTAGAYTTTTVAGMTSHAGRNDGALTASHLADPGSILLGDDDNTLAISDSGSCSIRTIDIKSGTVSTFAGGTDCNTLDGVGTAAQFAYPETMTWGPGGAASNAAYVVEEKGVIRRIDIDTAKVTTIHAAVTDAPKWRGITANSTHLYVTDEWSNQVLRMPIAGGDLEHYFGTASGCDDGPVATAQLGVPRGIVADGDTGLYVFDSSCHRLRRIDLATSTISTVAGGDDVRITDGIGEDARFLEPRSLAWDRAKKGLFLMDRHTVRYFEVATSAVRTLVGSPLEGGSVWLYPDTPHLNYPNGTAEGPDGTLYIAAEDALLRWGYAK
jgi:hypothetical protein